MLTVPPEGLTLEGAPDGLTGTNNLQSKANNLLLVKIPSQLRDAMLESSKSGQPTEFIAGKTPVSLSRSCHGGHLLICSQALRFGGKTHEISYSTEKYRHELYRLADSENSPHSTLAYTGTIASVGKITELQKVAEAAAGAEAAEEQLKRSLQRLREEKESKKYAPDLVVRWKVHPANLVQSKYHRHRRPYLRQEESTQQAAERHEAWPWPTCHPIDAKQPVIPTTFLLVTHATECCDLRTAYSPHWLATGGDPPACHGPHHRVTNCTQDMQ
jgi:hypothetical protein